MEDNTGTMIKLTSRNYTIWNSKIEDILFYKDMYDLEEKREAKPNNVMAED